MIGIGKSIYWKLLSSFTVSIVLASLVILFMFSVFGPQTKIHPLIEKLFVQKTRDTAGRILSLQQAVPAEPLGKIIEGIHREEGLSMRLFDLGGNELAAATESRIDTITMISPSLIANISQGGADFRNLFRQWTWIYLVSVSFAPPGGSPMILQCYYPRADEEQLLMPRGFSIALIIFAGVTALITRFLTRPIRELTRAAQEVSKGHFGVTVTVRSNDEISQLKKTFNEMSLRLADYHKSRKELFADISHEIRSPLARIQSDAEILIDRDMSKEAMEQHLKAICTEVKGINQVIEDLSMLSRLEYNQLKLATEPSSLRDIIAQESAKFLLQLEEKGIAFKQSLPSELPLITMDAKRIGQVISNLLSNSLRYTPRGGSIEIGATIEGSLVEVWVKDTGSGIPREALSRVFNRFYRVDRSRSRTSGGTGLGLAICKHFIEAHGGTIRAESNDRQGTRISFTLPRAC